MSTGLSSPSRTGSIDRRGGSPAAVGAWLVDADGDGAIDGDVADGAPLGGDGVTDRSLQAARTRTSNSQDTTSRRMAPDASPDRSEWSAGTLPHRRDSLTDRLISAAGAISHVAGRLIRAGGLRQRGASMLVAGVLAVVAMAGIVLGIRADDATLRTFTAGELATGDHGERAFVNVEGSLASTYVVTYQDVNEDGQQQADEQGEAWNYFLVDEESRTGVTVQSDRPPSSIYTYRVSGLVKEDATYLAEDIEYFKPWLDQEGITLDPLRYVDATRSGSPTKVAIANGLPANGTAVEVEGSRSVNYLTVCSADVNNDGVCSDDEIDLFDVVVYDPVTKKAVTVLTATSPEFVAAEFTGMLERSPRAVAEAQKTDNEEYKLSDYGIRVSTDYLLFDGDEPASFGFLIPLALVLGLLALVIAVGGATGYLRFRPGGPIGAAWATLEPGGRIPLRVTGELRTPQGLVHVREAPADLVRFVMTPAEPPAIEQAPIGPPPEEPPPEQPATGEAPVGEELVSTELVSEEPVSPAPPVAPPSDTVPPVGSPPTTLIIERQDRPEGVAVGRGELTAMAGGVVTPWRGERPALRLEAGTGTLLVSFDSVGDRDRAAAELSADTGIRAGAS
jgi:hypothetical protein